jgi:pimeloyl-ACP methyl ester carboxylesterase
MTRAGNFCSLAVLFLLLDAEAEARNSLSVDVRRYIIVMAAGKSDMQTSKTKVRGTRRSVFLFFLILLGMCVMSCASVIRRGDEAERNNIIHMSIPQPVDHADPSGPKLMQRVDILIPKGVPHDAPVFFYLGHERPLTDEFLLKLHRLYGEEHKIIYVQAEHRGYGQSLTDDEDQSVPSYVRIDQALADAHVVVHQLKKEYPGPWMAAGWSYGGALVIEFASKYPDDVAVILCSSGVVDWPFLDYDYDRQVRKTLGNSCYKRLVRHMKNLEPKELFDANWQQREFLRAAIIGMVQFPKLKSVKPGFQLLSFLPTGAFLAVLHRMDNALEDGEARRFAQGAAARKVGPEQIAAGIHNWHTWRYQMCTEIDIVLTSDNPEGLFAGTPDEFYAECRELFGQDPPSASAPQWSPRELLKTLPVPLIYVSGGTDPLFSLCLKPDYKITNGKYFFVPEGRHAPDRDDPKLAREVLSEMLKYVNTRLASREN